MLWVPSKGKLQVQKNWGPTTGVLGTDVTTSGTASVKGTPAEIFASTSFDAYWVYISAAAYGVAATASQGALDILIGAATEDVLIANLLMGYCGGNQATTGSTGPKIWAFPLYIPAGSRIAAQAAGARLSSVVRVQMALYGGQGCPPFRTGTKVTTYGMGTVPDGTTITVGASGTEGGWTQVTASSTIDHFAYLPSIQITGDTTTNDRHMLVDVGIGGAGVEQEIGGDYYYITSGNEYMSGPYNCTPIFEDVPSGTRFVIRAVLAGALDAGYNCVLHAVS